MSITLRYKNEPLVLNLPNEERRLDFYCFRDILKAFLHIEESIPIVIKYENNYYSTPFGWPKEVNSRKPDLQIWHQIENSVEESDTTSSYLPHLFKLQKADGDIRCLGLFISPNVCLIPKKNNLFSDDYIDHLRNHKIVFFKKQNNSVEVDQEFDLNEPDVITRILGHQRDDNPFFIVQFKRNMVRWVPKKPGNKKRIRGNIIFFNGQTKMLSCERKIYLDVQGSNNIFIKYETDNMLPGAILVGDEKELIGIFTGDDSKLGDGKHFAQTNQIYKWISDLLQESIESKDTVTRNFLLDINDVEVTIPEIENVLKNIFPVKSRKQKITNPLNGAF